jgi:hypothetical protein
MVFFVNFALKYVDLFKSGSRMLKMFTYTSRNQYNRSTNLSIEFPLPF